MDAERRDWLTAQYVWAIQSDSNWHRVATPAVEHKNFGQFRRVTANFINDIGRVLKRDQDEPRLGGIQWAFIVKSLWEQAGGNPDYIMTDPGTLSDDYLTLLREGKEHCNIDGDKPATVELKPGTYAITFIEEKQTMPTINTNQNVAYESKTIIFGQDASLMSEDDLITAIKRVEGDIAKLKEVKTSSKKIAANVAALEGQLTAIVAVLDAR